MKSRAKLSYKNNYMIIRGEDLNMVHLSEIHTLLIDSTAVTISSFLLSEMTKKKIKVVFCDEKRNPQFELVPYYGSHNTSKKIRQQIEWEEKAKKMVWTEIIRQKITNQMRLLEKNKIIGFLKLQEYLEQIEFFDVTNREGHAAKVYFNSLFGKDFSRDDENDINAALDYGYSIILSSFNKEIVSNGYLTQLGIRHSNEFNPFNLTSDLMEPFRIIVDECVFCNLGRLFNHEYKLDLIDLLNKKADFSGRNMYISNIIPIYLRSIFNAIEKVNLKELQLFEFT